MTIYVCVGSGCHLKGSYEIIHLLKEAIKQHQLDATVELKASFCLGHCVNGVSIKLDDETFTGFNKDNFNERFNETLLPKAKGTE